jgi:hypothetical protein
MPEGTRFAHKSGELPGYRHDIGLLFLDAWVVSVSVMTHWDDQRLDAVRLLNRIGKEVHAAFTE